MAAGGSTCLVSVVKSGSAVVGLPIKDSAAWELRESSGLQICPRI